MTSKKGRRGNRYGGVRFKRGKWRVRFRDADNAQREKVVKATSKREALVALAAEIERVERERGRGPIRTVAELRTFVRRQKLALGRSVADLDKRWLALADTFAQVDVNAVSSALVADYCEMRATTPSARTRRPVVKSTINRELACLKHLLRTGAQATPPLVRWESIPRIALADESDLVREIWVDEEKWARLYPHLAPHLQPLFVLAFWIGWRRGEMLGLKRAQVDLRHGTIRLASGSTKNKEGRLIFLPTEALTALRQQERVTRTLERKLQRVIPWVFHYRGERIGSYATGWRQALRRAGFAPKELRPHDFRRTAARAYTRAGVTEQVAMKITGHKTASMFRRYNITGERDLADAAQRVSMVSPRAGEGRARDGGGK